MIIKNQSWRLYLGLTITDKEDAKRIIPVCNSYRSIPIMYDCLDWNIVLPSLDTTYGSRFIHSKVRLVGKERKRWGLQGVEIIRRLKINIILQLSRLLSQRTDSPAYICLGFVDCIESNRWPASPRGIINPFIPSPPSLFILQLSSSHHLFIFYTFLYSSYLFLHRLAEPIRSPFIHEHIYVLTFLSSNPHH